MKPIPVLLLAWLLAGVGSVAGSILGNALGATGLKVGALLGGGAAIIGAVFLACRVGWLPRSTLTLALVGGLLAYAVAAALAVTHLSTPVVPVLSAALVGVGVLLGAGIAKGIGRGA